MSEANGGTPNLTKYAQRTQTDINALKQYPQNQNNVQNQHIITFEQEDT